MSSGRQRSNSPPEFLLLLPSNHIRRHQQLRKYPVRLSSYRRGFIRVPLLPVFLMSNDSPPNSPCRTADSEIKSTKTEESLGSTIESEGEVAVKEGELNAAVSSKSTEVGTDRLDTNVGERDDNRRQSPKQSTSSGGVDSSSGVIEPVRTASSKWTIIQNSRCAFE